MSIHFSSSIRVRYGETDQMGVAHHASYANWLEVNRIELCDVIGLPYKVLEKQGYQLPVLELNIHYHKPAYFDDLLTIELSAPVTAKVKFTIHYKIYRERILLATASTTHAFVNNKGQVMRPPAVYWEALQVYKVRQAL